MQTSRKRRITHAPQVADGKGQHVAEPELKLDPVQRARHEALRGVGHQHVFHAGLGNFERHCPEQPPQRGQGALTRKARRAQE